MKNKLFSLFVAAAVCLGMMACDNGAYDANPDTNFSQVKNPLNVSNSVGAMSARINNVFWSTNTGAARDTMGVLLISGITAEMKSIGISIVGYNGPGIYTIGTNTMAFYREGLNQYPATTGEAVVDSDQDGVLKGKFNFNAGSFIVTDGTFNVKRY